MPATPRELELKLELDPADAGRLKRRLAAEAGKKRRATENLASIYYDTPDFTLRRSGISLRLRRTKARVVQTIKSADGPAAVLLDRAEWEHQVAGPLPDLAAAKGTALARLLSDDVRRSLRPVFETRIRRTKYRLAADGGRVEAVLDEGEVDTGERRAAINELELELTNGAPEEVFGLARSFGRTIPLWLSVTSKADRGYALLEEDVDTVDKAADVHLRPETTTEEAFRVIGRNCLTQLVANLPAMLRRDSEALHQMRIAIRRLRAAMSTFADVIADHDEERIKSELKWLAGKLSPARDLDVLCAEVLTPLREQNPDEASLAALARNFTARRARAYGGAARAVDSARCRDLVLTTAEWIEAGPWRKDEDDLRQARRAQPVAAPAAAELARRRKRIRKKGRKLRQLDVRRRHKLRVAGKKLRYAAEFFADLFPGKKNARRRKAFLSALKDFQDALGALNDIATREKLAADLALAGKGRTSAPRARERAFAAGIMFGTQEAQTERCLAAAEDAYEKLAKVKPFWM